MKTFLWYYPCAVTMTLCMLAVQPVPASDEPGKPTVPNSVSASQYVGSDTCMGCHEDVYKKEFATTPHFQTTKKDGHGCETCHGPGGEHVSGGGDKTKIIRFSELTALEASRRCLECHGDSQKQKHFSSSSHLSNDVGCLNCHDPHHAKESQFLLVHSKPGRCGLFQVPRR